MTIEVFCWNGEHQAPLTEIAGIILESKSSIIYHYDDDDFWMNIIIVGAKTKKEALDCLLKEDWAKDMIKNHGETPLKMSKRIKIWDDYEK